MTWTLLLLLCNFGVAECHWEAVAESRDERQCMFLGLANMPFNPHFKCVRVIVPLPRPRPKL